MIRDARGIAITAVLAAVQFALAATRTGSVPLPSGFSVSIFSVPAVLGGVLVGILSAAIVGLVFGVMTLTLATTPLFQNPIVAILPRLAFGPAAAVAYSLVRPASEAAALFVAGALGPIVNTGLVLLLAAVLTSPVGAPYLSPEAAWDVARSNIPAEALLGAIVTFVVGFAARAANLSRR